MPYAFTREEPISQAIPRLVLEQVERAAGHLTSADEPAEKRVHNARKRIKETRAVLRLVRGALGGAFAVENRWYRDAARDLASARDAQAVIEALEKLPLDKRTLARTKKALEKRKSAIEPAELQARIENTVAQLDDARTRVGTWPVLPDRFSTIGDGLEQIYRDGRRAMRVAREEATPHNLHEWRKRVKDHWYHLQLFRPVWPEVLKAHAATLEQLSGALGDHHDLHVLEDLVDDDRIKEAIATRLRELESEAFVLGGRIFAERPADLHARMRGYWKAWRG